MVAAMAQVLRDFATGILEMQNYPILGERQNWRSQKFIYANHGTVRGFSY